MKRTKTDRKREKLWNSFENQIRLEIWKFFIYKTFQTPTHTVNIRTKSNWIWNGNVQKQQKNKNKKHAPMEYSTSFLYSNFKMEDFFFDDDYIERKWTEWMECMNIFVCCLLIGYTNTIHIILFFFTHQSSTLTEKKNTEHKKQECVCNEQMQLINQLIDWLKKGTLVDDEIPKKLFKRNSDNKWWYAGLIEWMWKKMLKMMNTHRKALISIKFFSSIFFRKFFDSHWNVSGSFLWKEKKKKCYHRSMTIRMFHCIICCCSVSFFLEKKSCWENFLE